MKEKTPQGEILVLRDMEFSDLCLSQLAIGQMVSDWNGVCEKA